MDKGKRGGKNVPFSDDGTEALCQQYLRDRRRAGKGPVSRSTWSKQVTRSHKGQEAAIRMERVASQSSRGPDLQEGSPFPAGPGEVGSPATAVLPSGRRVPAPPPAKRLKGQASASHASEVDEPAALSQEASPDPAPARALSGSQSLDADAQEGPLEAKQEASPEF